ncbi:hypothetical protein RJ640_026848 [Escallonia rubra]|uniref:FAD-binding domain-containing protein n=1 Tax=Escallonia rubra TaxID=112253 RepID=A0AA88R8A8_9ASTE|nr:hypothetical protein RJ640_026848 [Escallonia rubra]
MEVVGEEDIVIVGAGIAGLTTSLGLHRLGIRSSVLESSESLRVTGFAFTTWTNAWKALDAIGIGDSLRQHHQQLHGELCRGVHEVRCVKRKALLETLEKELPNGTIRYSSKVVSIEDSGFLKLVHLADGTTLKAKVLIGCDGVNSLVARWLGFKKPAFAGRSAIRGYAYFEESHGFEPKFLQFFGKGIRYGIVPCDNHAVYWFFTYTRSPQDGEMEEDPVKMKQFVLRRLGGVPDQVKAVTQITELGNIIGSPLRFRHPWDLLFGHISKGNVCVAGDAFHPMTPDIGQGGCAALEDGVVLARCLGRALMKKSSGEKEDKIVENENKTIKLGLEEFARERRWRGFELISTAYLVGFVQQSDGKDVATPNCLHPSVLLLPVKLRSSLLMHQSHLMEVAGEEDIAIVGAGIAGLTTSLGLHRLGIRSLVLESSESLRVTGFAFTTWTNAWKALDAIGIGDSLRQHHQQMHGVVAMSTISGLPTSELSFTTEATQGVHEVRCVKRKTLLETLEKELPNGTIRYSSKVVSIEDSGFLKLVHLADGTTFKAKVLIGCDGVNSLVARWLGFKKPAFAGRFAIRGFAYFKESHGFEPKFLQFFGKGVRYGIVPCDNHAVYWFFSYTPSPQDGEMEEDPVKMKQFVLRRLGEVPDQVKAVIEITELGDIIGSPLRFRHPWDLLFGHISKGNVCVAGDAFHPMTPDLGQGGCAALEDGVVLARCLGRALMKKPSGEKEDKIVENENKMIKLGLEEFARERRWRGFELISTAYLVGFAQQSDGKEVELRDSQQPWDFIGFAFMTWTNAWKALDALGIGDSLRQQHQQLQGEGHEVRCVKRKELLETLEKELPSGTIRFSSKVVSIESSGHQTLVHLADDTTLRTKVLIGCDGVNSVVAKWLGFKKPAFSGRSAFRGYADFKGSHGFGPKFLQYFGEGVKYGFLPCDDHTVYWFFTYTPSPQDKDMEEEPVKRKQYALSKLGKASTDQTKAVLETTELNGIVCSPLRFRRPWELLWGNISKGNVCIAGDALHPMTPDLGQGGCSAIEDGVVLARCLGEALKKKPSGETKEKIEENESTMIKRGLKKYAKERKWRGFGLISTAYMIGFIQQSDGKVINFFRDKMLGGFLAGLLMKRAAFDCGKLTSS